MFKAEIIADSKNEFGNRITTFIITFPRIILAEFNTHRMLSRNSASSRAIPFEKMLKSVTENPFIPIKWMKDHKGMQGSEYFGEELEINLRNNKWKDARWTAMEQAEKLSELGVSKQICNRLLEPFMWHTVIVTATEWENFFALRAHKDAEIHMQKIAYMMLEEYNKSEPKYLKEGEWHIPFREYIDWEKLVSLHNSDLIKEDGLGDLIIKISTARCARVSYTVVGETEKEKGYYEDVVLHDRLKESGHMSPFEHCAQSPYLGSFTVAARKRFWSGNFLGFIQYRKLIEGENKQDLRVNKK